MTRERKKRKKNNTNKSKQTKVLFLGEDRKNEKCDRRGLMELRNEEGEGNGISRNK